MATTIRTPIGAVAIDNLRYDDDASLVIFNKLPEDDETRVKVDTAISFWLAAYSSYIDAATVKVWISVATDISTRALIYDGSAGGFQAGYSGTDTFQASPGAGGNDELIFSATPATALLGDTLYKLEVLAETSGSDTLSTSYLFTTEATDPPCVDELLWLDPRRVRARWREPMQDDANVGGTRYLVNLSGAVEFVSPNKLNVINITPSTDWIGYWLGTSGSAYPQDNGFFEVLSVDTALRQITVDTQGATFKADDGIDKDADGNIVRRRTLRATLTSYKLEPRPQDETDIVCAFAPTVIALSAPSDDQIPQGADASQYVIIDLHDDISIERMYRMHCARALNDVGLAASAGDGFAFTSPSFSSPTGRIQLWDVLPETDKDEDLAEEGQLRRMVCVLQDALNVLWYRCDTLTTLMDPDACPRQWVDYLLYTLGNPFRFPLTELQKRRLISVLVGIYQRIGTKRVIEDTLAFFLGISFEVQPFLTADFWTLGTGILGVTSVLGPSDAYARNAYEVVSPVTLTEEQRRQVREIAEFLDPVYMHLVRIVEPGETPGTLLFWVLGESALGVTTQLAP